MVALSIVVGTSAALSLLGYLAWRGFYDGDGGDDVIVRAQRISRPAGSVSVGVAITNPGHAPALVALALRSTWGPRWAGRPPCRQTVLRPSRLSLADRTIGALAAGETARFLLSARRTRHPLELEVTVGSSRRLRRHRLDVAALATSLDLAEATDARDLARRHLSGEVRP